MVFIGVKLAAKFAGYSVQYDLRALSAVARSLLKQGNNRNAVHCHQIGGDQYIDLGLLTVTNRE